MEKILVVDDEVNTVRLIKKYLKSEAYDVYSATSGLDALNIVAKVNPKIVLLDILMPGMGGLDVLKEIKKVNPKIIVFIVTAIIDDELQKRAFQCGADDYITKPFDLDVLGKRLRIKMLQLLQDEEKEEGIELKDNDEDENNSYRVEYPAKKILLIDDEENFCHALKMGLEMNGNYHVMTASIADDGIVMAKLRQPDVILLDIMMPDKTGPEIAEELLEHPSTKSIPIIFVTAIVSKEELKKNGNTVGGQLFIPKPIILDELIQKIESITC